MTVDTLSVKFGPAGARIIRASVEDVNGDGQPDRIFQFRTADTGIAAGQSQICLTGKTISGFDFVGCDTIRTVPSR